MNGTEARAVIQTGRAPRIPLNPERLAVVLAAQFEHAAAGVGAASEGIEGLLQPLLRVRRVGDEGLPVGVVQPAAVVTEPTARLVLLICSLWSLFTRSLGRTPGQHSEAVKSRRASTF